MIAGCLIPGGGLVAVSSEGRKGVREKERTYVALVLQTREANSLTSNKISINVSSLMQSLYLIVLLATAFFSYSHTPRRNPDRTSIEVNNGALKVCHRNTQSFHDVLEERKCHAITTEIHKSPIHLINISEVLDQREEVRCAGWRRRRCALKWRSPVAHVTGD